MIFHKNLEHFGFSINIYERISQKNIAKECSIHFLHTFDHFGAYWKGTDARRVLPGRAIRDNEFFGEFSTKLRTFCSLETIFTSGFSRKTSHKNVFSISCTLLITLGHVGGVLVFSESFWAEPFATMSFLVIFYQNLEL